MELQNFSKSYLKNLIKSKKDKMLPFNKLYS